jgi:tubulin polyglutamylase TTLL4
MGINYQYVHAQFQDLIMKTLMCVEPTITKDLQKNPTSRNNCFELYGFDIIVDANLKPWVLEVNVMPSLSSSSPFDKRIKTMLICDALTLVGIRGYDKSKFHS